MVDSAHTFNGPANANTGPGNQYNYFYAERRRRRAPNLVSPEHVKWLAERFVPPPGFPDRVSARTVVIRGAEGVGKRTAALMLLTDTGRHGLDSLRVLDLAEEDPEDQSDPDDIVPGERLLLDLTAFDDQRLVDLRDRIETHRAAVEIRGAHLVVMAGERTVTADSLTPLLVTVRRPAPQAVFRAHLRSDGIILPDRVPEVDGLGDYLARSSVGRVAELARLVVQARDMGEAGDLITWLSTAVRAGRDRAADAERLFTANADPGARALLTVAAFVPGASVETLIAAEQVFHRKVGLPDEPAHPFAGPHLAERLVGLRLRTNGGRRVEFEDLALDEAVRAHFWTYFPSLRDGVGKWVEDMVGDLGPDIELDLVGGYLQAALATGPVDPLLDLVRGSVDKGRPTVAAQVLSAGLAHPTHSWRFRRFVYERSRDRATAPDLSKVLVTACAHDIAPGRPAQALVRLHHFTRHHDGDVADAALDALLDVVRRHRYQRWMLRRLDERPLTGRDPLILLGLTIPRTDPARATQAGLWRQMFRDTTRQAPGDHLWQWIVDDPDLVVNACSGRPRQLNQLYLLARARLRSAGTADRLTTAIAVQGLLHRIDAALGAQPTEGRS